MHKNCLEEEKRTIDSSVILNEIHNGIAKIYNCYTIKGDLELPPSTTVNCPITITNSIIQGNIKFENIIFNNSLDFRETTFEGITCFKGSTFNHPSEFENAHFIREAYFDPFIIVASQNHGIRTHFIGSANFKKTVFERYADFSHAIFDRGADFSSQNNRESSNCKSIFKGHTIFIGARFERIAHFEECEFQDIQFGVEFRGAWFEKEAYFQRATFSGYVTFLESTFKEYTDFSNAKFLSKKDGVGFAEAKFEGYVTDFRNVLFNGIFANFRNTKFTGEFVSFRNAKFRNITDQERACRKAKKQLNNSGNRNEEDYMFYAEMDARRRQKGITKTPYPESSRRAEWGAMSFPEFIDYFKCALINHEWSKFLGFFLYNLIGNFIFRCLFGGYGIYWYWIAAWWIFISILMGIYYWMSQGIVGAPCLGQSIYFSFLVAFTRGYGDCYPKPMFEYIVTGEIIFGLIMFGIFIASITRKYMR